MNSKRWAVIGGCAVSVGLIVWLFYGLDWAAFGLVLGQVKLRYLPILALLTVLFQVLRAARWRYLLPGEHWRFTSLFDAVVVGVLGTILLPLRGGELVRGWAAREWLPVSFATAMASIIVERVFDVLLILVIFAFCLQRIGEAPEILILGSQALGVLGVTIGIFILLGYVAADRMLSFGRIMLRLVFGERRKGLQEKLLAIANDFLQGLKGISSWKQLGAILIISIFIWLDMGLFYQVALLAFGQESSFVAGNLVGVVIALAVAAPSSPGFVGTFQAGCVIALSSIYRHPKEFALAYAVFVHVLQIVVIFCVGIYVLRRRGLSFRELRSAKT